MMNSRTAFCILTLGFVSVALAGCGQPGDIDQDVLIRYQQSMAGRDPQRVRGSAGLELLRPAPRKTGPKLKIEDRGPDQPARIELTLDDAIMLALLNNPEIHVISYDPQIQREQMIQAAAEFDYTVFGSYSYGKEDLLTDEVFGGGQERTRSLQAGLKQKTITGAEWSLAWTMSRIWDNSAIRTLRNRYETTLALETTQPLLRGAWPEFNLANLKITRLNHKISVAAFRDKVESVVTNVITGYWAMKRTRRDLEIQRQLLGWTFETLNRVEARRDIDATTVEIQQAKAAVSLRHATLVRAEKNVLDAQDILARLLSDSRINLMEDIEIIPVSELISEKLSLDPTDQMFLALQYNPVLEQTRLAIQQARVNVRVAKNQVLPRLDLIASASLHGMGVKAHDAQEVFESGDYFSYNFGLLFEYPIGNRQRRSKLRARKMDRLKAVAKMQDIADQVALALKDQIRRADAAWRELQDQRAAVEASRIQLGALEDVEEIRGRLTPEFLLLKLQTQETLASAQRAEIQAIVNYNTALVALARVTGTILELHRVGIVLPSATEEDEFPMMIVPEDATGAAEVFQTK